jgi:hypothetical protein
MQWNGYTLIRHTLFRHPRGFNLFLGFVFMYRLSNVKCEERFSPKSLVSLIFLRLSGLVNGMPESSLQAQCTRQFPPLA